MRISIEVRNIPEIKEAFTRRANKKDSFHRWLRKANVVVTFNDLHLVEVKSEY